jgi:IS30 family transposase
MSFSADCVQFGDRLAKLVDAGATVREAGARPEISHQLCCAILRAAGSRRAARRGADPAVVVAVFDATGSVNAAAKASGISMLRRGVCWSIRVDQQRPPTVWQVAGACAIPEAA